MSFTVKPESLDAFAGSLKGLTTDVNAAKEYIHKHLSYDYGDARMFFTIASANNDVKSEVLANLDRLNEILTASADELGKAAKTYRETDDAEERRLDATYPGE